MRLFTAILLPDGLRKRLAGLARYFSEHWNEELLGLSDRDYPPAKWVPAANLHVTLKFFGEVSDPDVKRLYDALSGISSAGAISAPGAMRLELDHLECLPPRGPVRIIAAGLGGDVDKIQRLFEAIEQATFPLGFMLERRRYRPHITLARMRAPLPAHTRRKLAAAAGRYLPMPPFQANGFVLMQSKLGGEAPQYLPIARFGRGQ